MAPLLILTDAMLDKIAYGGSRPDLRWGDAFGRSSPSCAKYAVSPLFCGRGFFPLFELCGSIMAMNLARRDILGDKMNRLQLFFVAVSLNAYAVFRVSVVAGGGCVVVGGSSSCWVVWLHRCCSRCCCDIAVKRGLDIAPEIHGLLI